MERTEIDKLAYRGEELPNDSNIFDEIYWLAMYYLYKTATLNNIPAEQAAKAKRWGCGRLFQGSAVGR